MAIAEIVSMMNNFWVAKHELTQAYKKASVDSRNFQDFTIQRIALHLTHYLFISNKSNMFFSEDQFGVESLLALRKWTQLSVLCKSIPESTFRLFSPEEKDDYLLTHGLCTAIVIDHFKCFFENTTIFQDPFQFQKTLVVENGKAIFYSLGLNKENFKQKSINWRFLQAVHKMSCLFETKKNLGYFSSTILEKYNLRLSRRIPEFQEKGRGFFYIEDLIPQLKKCEKGEKAYLLGISNYIFNHSIGVHLAEPYHFIDPSFGIGTAESIEDLLLFLSNYLTEKYPSFETFAILEFDRVSFKAVSIFEQ